MLSTGRLKSKYAAMFTSFNNENALKPVNTGKQSAPLWHNDDLCLSSFDHLFFKISKNVANLRDEKQ